MTAPERTPSPQQVAAALLDEYPLPPELSGRLERELVDARSQLLTLIAQNGKPTHHILNQVMENRFQDLPDAQKIFVMHQFRERCEAILDEAMTGKKPRSIVVDLPSEIQMVMDKVDEIGPGVVILGSAQTPPEHPDYRRTMELARETGMLWHGPIWTGAGPGLMEAGIRGGVQANTTVAGVKIDLVGMEQAICSLLPRDRVTVHNRFSSRKIGLCYAGQRTRREDRTAYLVMPGGFGTIDEFMEFLVLMQTNKFCSPFLTPMIIANYDNHYTEYVRWIREEIMAKGYAKPHHAKLMCVCESNAQILEELADFYHMPEQQREFRSRLDTQHSLFGDVPPGYYRRNGIDMDTLLPFTDTMFPETQKRGKAPW